MFKRGISPLIATVLIIGFTVALGAVVIEWGSSFIKSLQQSAETIEEQTSTCAAVSLLAENVEQSAPNKVDFLLENQGQQKIKSITIRITGNLGTESSTNLGLDIAEKKAYSVEIDPTKIGVPVTKMEMIPSIEIGGKSTPCVPGIIIDSETSEEAINNWTENCGNNEIDEGEECDGLNFSNTTCLTSGFLGGAIACSEYCTFDTNACTNVESNETCGNGLLDEGEECDFDPFEQPIYNAGNSSCLDFRYSGGELSCIGCVINTSSCTGAGKVVSVKDFGAKGDGVNDDYTAMKLAANYTCLNPGTTLIYPPGVYKIGVYRYKVNATVNNGIVNIVYNKCNNVNIIGYGAKIDAFGAFKRAGDVVLPDRKLSYSGGVIPFYFLSSSNFRVEGFEIDGNVDQMTRDKGVSAGSLGGITTYAGNNYTLKNMYIHHFEKDGMLLGMHTRTTDKKVVIDGVRSSNNSRQALSIINVRGAIIKNSIFENTGGTGAYGIDSPVAGVDIEPISEPPTLDIKTGDITFDNDTFQDNIGAQIISAHPDVVESITISNSRIIKSFEAGSGTVMLVAPATAKIENNIFNIMGRGAIMIFGNMDTTLLSKIEFTNNKIYIKVNNAIISGVAKSLVNAYFANNEIYNSNSTDNTIMNLSWMNTVENNKFYLKPIHMTGDHNISYFSTQIERNNQYLPY